MSNWQNIEKIEQGIWTVYIDVTDEDLDPRDCFDYDEEEMKKIILDIEWGNIYWFRARARAYASDVMLGEDYLGACSYQNYDEFLEDFYCKDLVANAIREGQLKLNELKKVINISEDACLTSV